ncbi:hypothetical protein [Clostridium beijerinckii]|uniref:hypothetical protein n=1 Tax=Clostridium beijerinckii TaxID=1520 RepID=UPI001F277290|nr:hypothetical protein [Clostridium beijerinckii]
MRKFMAFDIGGSSVKWSVINENGEFIENGKFNVPSDKEEFFLSYQEQPMK